MRNAKYFIKQDRTDIEYARRNELLSALDKISISQVTVGVPKFYILPNAQTSVRADSDIKKNTELYVRTAVEGKVEKTLRQILDEFGAVLLEGDRNMRSANEDYHNPEKLV